jgi:hypothetical protein
MVPPRCWGCSPSDRGKHALGIATVWEGLKRTFTVKTGLKCVVIPPSRSPARRPMA